jgi:hypothetical protein
VRKQVDHPVDRRCERPYISGLIGLSLARSAGMWLYLAIRQRRIRTSQEFVCSHLLAAQWSESIFDRKTSGGLEAI